MHLQHGIWADEGKSVPPETIKPGKMSDDGLDPTKMSFASESQGVLTGTEGTCDYISDKDGPDGKKVPLHFHWSVPQSGSNTYDPSVGGPLRLETDGGLQGLNIWMGTAIAPQKKG
jgi:hypothetical protein